MKKLIFASGLLALMAAATSCEKYDIYPEQFDSVFSIRDAGSKDITLYATDDVYGYPVVIMKGGYDPEVQSTATIKVMNDDEFMAYAESLGAIASYIKIGKECYSFSAEEGDEPVLEQTYEFMSADKKAEIATLYIRPRSVLNWIEENEEQLAGNEVTPVIPVILTSATDTVSTYSNALLLKIDIKTPALTFDVPSAPSVVPRTYNKQNFVDSDPSTYTYSPVVNFQIPCANPWGFKLKVISDHKRIRDIVDDYSLESGIALRMLPETAYTLNPEIVFEPGTETQQLDLKITVKDLDVNKVYAVAVAFDGDGLYWDDENNNPGNALAFDKSKYMIFTIRVINSVPLKKLALDESMVTANDCMEGDGGGVPALFDNDPATWFHSYYSAAGSVNRTETYGSYLEITLPEAKSLFRFSMQCRNSNALGAPRVVYLYGKNDENEWPTTPFARISNMNEAGKLDAGGAIAEFGTDEEPFGDGIQSYKYIRFCVMESASGSLTAPGTTFWNAAELQLYTD